MVSRGLDDVLKRQCRLVAGWLCAGVRGRSRHRARDWLAGGWLAGGLLVGTGSGWLVSGWLVSGWLGAGLAGWWLVGWWLVGWDDVCVAGGAVAGVGFVRLVCFSLPTLGRRSRFRSWLVLWRLLSTVVQELQGGRVAACRTRLVVSHLHLV